MMIKNITKTIMILWVLGILLFLGSSCLVTDAFLNELLYGTETKAVTIAGTYYSDNWGEIVLKQDGNHVTGTYATGTIEGTVTGDTLEGTWSGAYSGGRMKLKFSSDSSRFEGYYSSGNQDPGPESPSGERWVGNRTGTSPSQAKEEPVRAVSQPEPVTKKSYSSVDAPPSGFDVTGKYRTSLGELSLIQTESEVSGTYPQSTLSGQMSGQVLTGNIYSLGTTAEIRFVFAADGSNFQGEMYYQGSTYVWNGTKISSTVDRSKMADKKIPQQPDVPSTQSEAKSQQSQPQAPFTIAGTYYSDNWGEIVLKQDGNRVTGTYGAGTIEGTVTGDTLEGTWSGAYLGGRLKLKFSSDSSRFEGYYSSGKQDPGPESPSGIRWVGTRTGSSPSQAKEVAVQQSTSATQLSDPSQSKIDISGTYQSSWWNTIVLYQNGNKITGTHENGTFGKGTIEGTLEGFTVKGTWLGPWTGGNIELYFSPDSSNFEGYWAYYDIQPGPNIVEGKGGTLEGFRTGAAPSSMNSEALRQQKDMDSPNKLDGSLGRIEDLYGGWIDMHETISGFVFKSDTTLLMFSDGEIFEGYWTSNGKELTLFTESAQGDYTTFEGSYTYDGKNLFIYMDGYELVLDKHWVASIDDIQILFEQSGNVKNSAPGSQIFSIAGTYNTNFGKMTLVQTGNSITGEYPLGAVVGTLSGREFNGTFESMGTIGTFNLTFSSDASGFTGKMIVDKYTDYLWEGTVISKN